MDNIVYVPEFNTLLEPQNLMFSCTIDKPIKQLCQYRIKR